MADRGPNRWDAEAAVKASALPPPSRLLLLVLLTRVTNGTLDVPSEFSPSLSTLVKETGLGKSAVTEHLGRLEADGWLVRHRPTTAEALRQRARTTYRIQVPVREADQSVRRTSPDDGQVPEDALFTTCPRGGPVREPDRTSPGGGHTPMSSTSSSSPTERKTGGGGGRGRAKTGSEHPDFAAWYAEYPSKVNRPAAVKAFPAALAKAGDVQVLINGVKRYRTIDKVRRGFVQNPATWLTGEGWLDEAAPAPRLAATGTDGTRGYGPNARVNDIDWSQGGPRL